VTVPARPRQSLERPQHSSPRVDGHFARAATEVRAASRELTHSTITIACPDKIAARPGLDRATSAILHALETRI
jgi:hypothetical protein